MNITIIGTGYVGLVTGVCLAEIGHQIICIDHNEQKIDSLNKGIPPNYEPKLESLLKKNLDESRITFTTDYVAGMSKAEVIFIAVGTPIKADGDVDLTDFYKVGVMIAQNIKDGAIIVTKSTVPIGTNEILTKLIAKTLHNKRFRFSVVSNPEFLREGSAVDDTFYSERIIIGTEDDEAARVLKQVYEPLKIPIFQTCLRSAEMIKYASNAFLAMKISYINEIASLCEKMDANIDDVARGMGLDSRIGSQFLKAGIGFGGSCFPKDLVALKNLSEREGHSFRLIQEVIDINKRQQKYIVELALERFGSLSGMRVAMLGLAFKPNTDDVREAPSITIANELLEAGAIVVAYDPRAISNAKKVLRSEVEYVKSFEEALRGSEVTFIVTEWDEFKQIQPQQFIELMRSPVIFDGRNCFSLDMMAEWNVEYHSIGRPAIYRNEQLPTAMSK